MEAGAVAGTIGIAAGIALVIGMLKSVVPLGKRWPPPLALVLAIAAVVAGRVSGELDGQPLELGLFAIAQAAEAIGLREGFRLAAGDERFRVSVGPAKRKTSAPTP